MAEEIIADIGGTYLRLFQKKKSRFQKLAQAKRTELLLPQQLTRLIKKTGQRPFSIRIGMRGVWTKSERKKWTHCFSTCAQKVFVESDVELAHYFAFGDKPGILLIAGTGSICLGRNKKGKISRAGGLGPVVGDEGSAFWIGREYMKRSGKFSAKLIRGWGQGLELVRRFASHAPSVLNRQDELSRTIQNEAMEHLLILARAVKSKLKIKNPAPIHLSGGVFSNQNFKKKVSNELKRNGFKVG